MLSSDVNQLQAMGAARGDSLLLGSVGIARWSQATGHLWRRNEPRVPGLRGWALRLPGLQFPARMAGYQAQASAGKRVGLL
jgi:hypothetical protein